MLKGFPITAVCLAVSSGMALAKGATIEDKVGTILVSSGAGFSPVSEGAILAPTDIVSARVRSTAFLVYPDGCRTKLVPGRAVTVGSTSCAAGRELADLPNPAAEPVMPPVDPGVGGIGIGPAPVVGGIVLAGAAIGAGVVFSNRHHTVSPVPGGGGRGVSP